MSLFDFILALLLAFNPGISDVDFDNVYSILDDTSIHSIVVDDSAFDRLSHLAGADVMPLDLTTQQNTWFQEIRNALYNSGRSALTYSGYDVAYSLYLIKDAIGTVSGRDLSSLLNDIRIGVNNIRGDFGFYSGENFRYFLKRADTAFSYFTDASSASSWSYPGRVIGLLEDIKTSSGSGGWDTSFVVPWFDTSTYSLSNYQTTPMQALAAFRNDLLPQIVSAAGYSMVAYDGNVFAYDVPSSFTGFLNNYFLGSRNFLVGDDRQTAFTFLVEDITEEPEEVHVYNILDALGVMGTQLQNPLQRLAYVFANPLDLEIRENVSENQEAANENFFKPGSAGSVKPSDIGDAAGFVSGAGDLLQAGGSPGDAFAQLGQGSDNWGFFSQAAMDDMLGSPPPSTQSDDFGELGEDGLYHLLPSHLFEVDSMLGKGG